MSTIVSGSEQGTLLLLNNVGATGNGPAAAWPGGTGVFGVTGTFSGTTAKLQASLDLGATWVDVDRSGDVWCTLTAAGFGRFTLPECFIRAVLTGGTPASINAYARKVPS